MAQSATEDAVPYEPLRGALFWLPVVAIEIYLNLSIALYAFGPWLWPVVRVQRMYAFVLLAHLALFVGYATASRRTIRQYIGAVSPPALLWAAIVVTLLLFPPTLYSLTAGSLDIRAALADPSVAYYRYQEMQAGGRGGWIVYVRLFGAPFFPLLMPLTIFWWRKISPVQRILGIIAILSDLLLYVATGRNKGLVDLVLLGPWLLAIYVIGHRIRLRPGRMLLWTAIGAGFLLFVTNFYARNTSGRVGDAGSLMMMPLLSGVEADADNPMIRDRSTLTQIGVLGLTFSQTHGYGALALALDKDWIPTWGLGHSYFLQTVAQRVSGSDWVRAHSYPGRLERENGWPLTEYWHTIYPWLASDLSFPGTIIAVLLLGRLLALSWVDAVRAHNPYAMALFVLLMTMFYYFPTNNIVLGFPESLIGFWVVLAGWLRTRGAPVGEFHEGWTLAPAVPEAT